MPLPRRRPWPAPCAALLLLCVLVTRCDTVEPQQDDVLVVEAFFEAEAPLPTVLLRRTRSLEASYEPGAGTAAEGANVQLRLGTTVIPYAATPLGGTYAPAQTGVMAAARTPYTLDVAWNGQTAQATGTIPPPITLDSVRLRIPDAPVEAVLLDSLRLDTLGIDARAGFIYPIEVDLWWTTEFVEADADTSYWIETLLQPSASLSSVVVDFFLLPRQVLRERALPRFAQNTRRWTGLYAIPVTRATAPLPPHELKVALLRSGFDYARFATSRDVPDRREPISNVSGGLGIAVGVSVDSLRLQVE